MVGQIPWNAVPICGTFWISCLLGRTPYERRFGKPFDGPIIPFGSLVEYYPISAKDQSRIHQFGKNVLPGIFLGYALYAGVNLEGWFYGLQTLRSWRRWTHRKIDAKGLNAKEVIFPEECGKFIFLVADGRIKFVGGDQELRTSTLIRDHPIRVEDQRDFLGESEGSPPPLDEMIFGPFQETSYTAITLNPESNFTRREKNHHWNTLTSPELRRQTWMQESRIDDYWNIDGSRNLSGSCTGFTLFTL